MLPTRDNSLNSEMCESKRTENNTPCRQFLKESRSGYACLRQNFNTKIDTRDRQGYFIMTKGSAHQEKIAITNTLLTAEPLDGGKTDKIERESSSAVIDGDFNALLL